MNWWLLLKSTPRSRREKKEQQKFLQNFKDEIDADLRQRGQVSHKDFKTMVEEMLSQPKTKGGIGVGRRFIETKEPRYDYKTRKTEKFSEEPLIERKFDQQAGGLQPHATVHVQRQPRPDTPEEDRRVEVRGLDYHNRHPLDPSSNMGYGTKGQEAARRVQNERYKAMRRRIREIFPGNRQQNIDAYVTSPTFDERPEELRPVKQEDDEV